MITEMIELLNDFFDRRSRDIIIGCIGKIERHNLSTMRADVKPLIKYTASGETVVRDFAIIPQIPVMFLYAGGYYIRPEYKRGDLVWVTFATFAINQGLAGKSDDANGSVFSRESAAVVSGLAPTNWAAPADITKPGLLIGYKDGGTLIQIKESVIKIVGNVEVIGNVSASGNIEADGQVTAMKKTGPVNLSTHTHPTGVGPSEPPVVGS